MKGNLSFLSRSNYCIIILSMERNHGSAHTYYGSSTHQVRRLIFGTGLVGNSLAESPIGQRQWISEAWLRSFDHLLQSSMIG